MTIKQMIGFIVGVSIGGFLGILAAFFCEIAICKVVNWRWSR